MTDLESFRAWAAGNLAGLTYVGPDPHHGLGLERIVPGYRAASSHAPILHALALLGVSVLDVDRADIADAAAMLALPEVAAFIESGGPRVPVFVFKSSDKVESCARLKGWRLVTSSASLARRWENKVAFAARAASLGLPTPPWRVARGLAALEETRVALAGDVIIQAPHGYGGARTLRARSTQEAAEAARRLRSPELRVGPTIQGQPWTLNACVTARGTAVSAPTLQLTGVHVLTNRAFGACGNDGTQGTPAAAAMLAAARTVGDALAADGYAGLFGVDYVVDEAGAAWMIEVNPRLVSSIGLATQLEIAAGHLPLIARHFMAIADPPADAAPLDLAASVTLGGSQMVLHNLEAGPVMVTANVACGAWNGDHPEGSQRPDGPGATNVSDMHAGEWLLIPAGPGRLRAPGAEVARLQRRGPIVNRQGGLMDDALAAAMSVYAALKLEPVI